LQGLGAGFVPSILNAGALDGIVTVGKDEAYDFVKRVAKEEGIFVGISTGAALAAVAKKLPEIPNGSKVLTFNYDTGERYLSVDGLF
jgi:cysteine synthase A